jgi:hypothetical protein
VRFAVLRVDHAAGKDGGAAAQVAIAFGAAQHQHPGLVPSRRPAKRRCAHARRRAAAAANAPRCAHPASRAANAGAQLVTSGVSGTPDQRGAGYLEWLGRQAQGRWRHLHYMSLKKMVRTWAIGFLR